MSRPSPGKITLAQRILLLGFGLGLALLLLEVSLQGAALVYRVGRSSRPVGGEGAAPGDAVRVLCLGESTTAPFFGVVAYDRILEHLLNQRDLGARFQVINAGYPAAHTPTLVEKLPGLLDEHHPDMAILMMGINDHLYFDESDRSVLPLDLQLLLLRSRTYRLLRIVRQRLGASPLLHPEARVEPEHLQRFLDAGKKVLFTWPEQGPTPEVEKEVLSLIRMAREAASPASAAGGRVLDVPAPYLGFYQKAHEWLASIYRSTGREDEAIALYREAIERHPRAEYFHRKLGGLYQDLGESALAREELRGAEDLARRQVPSVTRASYRTAIEMLRERGVRIVAMQYPMRSVKTLRSLLDDPEDVIFVDNRAVFREAVAREGYGALFRDRFAGDFGHCTRKGNRLIAENLVRTVFEPLFGSSSSPAAALPARQSSQASRKGTRRNAIRVEITTTLATSSGARR